MVSVSAQGAVLADFDAAGTADTVAGQSDYVTYDDIATGSTATAWSYSKGWGINASEEMENTFLSNSTNRVAAVFSVDLTPALPTGKIWALELTIVAGGRDSSSSGLNDIDVLLGQDDGDNTTENVVKIASGNPVGQSGVVTGDDWNHVISEGWIYQYAADAQVLTIPFNQYKYNSGPEGTVEDLSSNDLMYLQVQSNSKWGNETIFDDVKLVQKTIRGNFDGGGYTTSDIDALTAVGDLTAGVDVTATPQYDLVNWNMAMLDDGTLSSNEANGDDLNAWLYYGARANGYYTAYKATDSNLDRTVDINDFLNLAGNYGTTGTAVFSDGDSDGNGDVDINDFLALAGDYDAGAGYLNEGDAGDELAKAGPGAGELELEVDLTTGVITVIANNASVGAFQIDSASDGLSSGVGAAGALTFVLQSTTDKYAEGHLGNLTLDGEYELDVTWDKVSQDLTFAYGAAGSTAGAGTVTYVPEPATMAILALGGVGLLRKRKHV